MGYGNEEDRSRTTSAGIRAVFDKTRRDAVAELRFRGIRHRRVWWMSVFYR